MINAETIKPFRNKDIGFAETEELKQHLSSLRKSRKPFYLDSYDFDKILRWKLRGQYGRSKHIREDNTDELIRKITALAFDISHSDPDYELELKVGILSMLKGVGVPVASAVLALVYPDKYGVVDFRVWRQIFDEDKRYFTLKDYKRYLVWIRRVAAELGWLPQEVDLAIWAYDMEKAG